MHQQYISIKGARELILHLHSVCQLAGAKTARQRVRGLWPGLNVGEGSRGMLNELTMGAV